MKSEYDESCGLQVAFQGWPVPTDAICKELIELKDI